MIKEKVIKQLWRQKKRGFCLKYGPITGNKYPDCRLYPKRESRPFPVMGTQSKDSTWL